MASSNFTPTTQLIVGADMQDAPAVDRDVDISRTGHCSTIRLLLHTAHLLVTGTEKNGVRNIIGRFDTTTIARSGAANCLALVLDPRLTSRGFLFFFQHEPPGLI